MATIFRGPLGIRRNPSPCTTSLSDVEVQNLLSTTLRGKDQFFYAPGEAPRYDYPNPRGKPYPLALRTFISSSIGFLGRDKFFYAAGEGPCYDYPNPRGKPYPSHLRTFISSSIGFLGRDKFFYAAGEGPNYNYPNPNIRKPHFVAINSQPQNNLIETCLSGGVSSFKSGWAIGSNILIGTP